MYLDDLANYASPKIRQTADDRQSDAASLSSIQQSTHTDGVSSWPMAILNLLEQVRLSKPINKVGQQL